MEEVASAQKDFYDSMDQMTKGLSSVREIIRSLLDKRPPEGEVLLKDGISLLSLKHYMMLSYLQSLTLLSAHRVLGHSLLKRTSQDRPFNASDRARSGSEAGDLVDNLIEDRIVLEKIKVLESKMQYQISKLVKLAKDAPQTIESVIEDPLAFRPNPQNLVGNDEVPSEGEEEGGHDDGVYRPPKIAPMPYTDAKEKSKRRMRAPSALTSLLHDDPSMPQIESTSGLGSMPSFSSSRAREIQRMTEFEEENMTRLVLNKREAKRRKRDEEDLAMGGTGVARGKARGGGLDAEFGDVLRAVSRTSRPGIAGDGYEELRQRSKKGTALERSRTRKLVDVSGGSDGPRERKRSRFEKAVKSVKRHTKQA